MRSVCTTTRAKGLHDHDTNVLGVYLQPCGGGALPRYWGLIRELQRLRVIEEERRRAWEVRIRATKEKMVAVR